MDDTVTGAKSYRKDLIFTQGSHRNFVAILEKITSRSVWQANGILPVPSQFQQRAERLGALRFEYNYK